jgi:c(7)-type cytochrome triheme protein
VINSAAKNKGIFLILATYFFCASLAYAEYGDIILNSKAESMREAEVDDVVFPHWFHRIRYRCSVCHENIFKLKAGSNDITMAKMTEHETACGKCHNGLIAWEPLECDRCHSLEPGWDPGPIQHSLKRENIDPLIGKVGSKAKPYSKFMEIASGWHPLALTASGLPLDKYGLVNWAEAVRSQIVDPLWTIDPDAKPEDYQTRNTKILFKAKGDHMPDVLFPHDIHSFWLQCKVCHETKNGAIFIEKAGANQMNMREIGQGKWCARCHDKVAFPISDCQRCHNHPKGSPIDNNTIIRIIEEPPAPSPLKRVVIEDYQF